MFRNWIWWLIGILLVLLVPIIPYEEEIEDGVTEVNHKCVAVYLFERYEKVQLQNVENQLNTESEPKE